MDELRVITRKGKSKNLSESDNLNINSKSELKNIKQITQSIEDIYNPVFFKCELFRDISAHESDIMALCLDKNNISKIYSGSVDRTIKVWNLDDGKLLNTLIGHTGSVQTLTIYDNKLFSGAADKTIRAWDIESGKLLFTILGHTNHIYSIIGYQNKFISSSLDKTIKIWDLNKKIILVTIHLESSAWALAAVNGKLIAGLSDGSLRVYDIESGNLLMSCTEHDDSITSLAADNKHITSASKDKTIKIWDLENLNVIKTIKSHNAAVWSVNLDQNSIISGSDDKTVKVWDLSNDFLMDNLTGSLDWVSSVNHDNSRIISASGDGKIKIWLKKPLYNTDNININFEVIEKSPFETEKEFLEKSDNYNKKINNILVGFDYMLIGKAQILPDNYSLDKKTLPLKISINKNKVSDFSKITNNFISSIKIERNEAEKLFKSSAFHDVYIKYFFEDNKSPEGTPVGIYPESDNRGILKLRYQLSVIFIDKKYNLDLEIKENEIIKKQGVIKSDRLNILPVRYDIAKEPFHDKVRNDCNTIDISDTFRSPFENQDDFEKRVKTKLLNYKEINIGRVLLIAEKYNIEQEIFPLKADITCDKIINLVNIKKEFNSTLNIDRYRARYIYEISKTHNLYIKFVEKDNTLFYELSIIYKDAKYFLLTGN